MSRPVTFEQLYYKSKSDSSFSFFLFNSKTGLLQGIDAPAPVFPLQRLLPLEPYS